MTEEITYPIMETFHTIQGEGSYTGHSAFFIRLGGCDVGCSWCDVKESWEAGDHPSLSLNQLRSMVMDSGAKIVIVTGGEPTMYDLRPLTEMLSEIGVRRHLESSGVYEITGDWDWICFSPKKFKEPLGWAYEQSHELKIVVLNKHDLKWAEGHAAKMGPQTKLYLQPEWSKSESMVPLIMSYQQNNPKWILSLQTHKFIGVL